MKRALPLVAAAALGAGCAAVPVYGDPTVGAPGDVLPARLYALEWTVPLVSEPPLLEYAPREAAGPAVDPESGRIIALTRDGKVHSVSPDGHVEWAWKTALPFNAPPRIAGEKILVSGGDGTLYALSARPAGPGGELLWESPYDSFTRKGVEARSLRRRLPCGCCSSWSLRSRSSRRLQEVL